MKKSRLVFLVLSFLLILNFTGCKKQEGPTMADIQNENSILRELLLESQAEAESMKSTLEVLTGSADKTLISTIETPEGVVTTLNTINDKIVFPVPLKYPESNQAPNTSSVNISQNVSISPSNNWLVKLDGSSTHFSHPSGIVGVIKVGSILQIVHPEGMKEALLGEFIESLPAGAPEFSDIFLETNRVGANVHIPVNIDGKEMSIRAGSLGVGYITTTYIFVYDGIKDNSKEELVDVLIRTLKVSNLPVRLN